MESYAKDFDLLKHIHFNSNVISAKINADNTQWAIEVEGNGATEYLEFDKVAFCHGYQTKAKIPVFDGQDKFQGIVMHSQQYRR